MFNIITKCTQKKVCVYLELSRPPRTSDLIMGPPTNRLSSQVYPGYADGH
ncbi:hypothetical protein COCCADRAFT_104386 [Bipolaris zeicola 26-R-13]|uniref:Uncharacterized protein n=1 Tax=Cochliobolus carbonum (strain 26-R-13) TaxID=930089 RepID=W6YGA0_COCC2|nr:uncharacterized protein COCCADRAFT_104386 [Bipolaris zeicola 26-R-13]EUC30246.1 hypothetical protein COCCADRAFT_104386 [Bipolaris zeicola 26-R-13]